MYEYKNKIFNMDCLAGMAMLPDSSVDMVLTDLPYGTTQNRWDSVIPLDELWNQYHRIVKKNGAMVFTASGLFTAQLMLSNPKEYKYNYTWVKSKSTNFLNAKKQPLRRFEDVCIFYKKQCTYNPQMIEREKPRIDNYSVEKEYVGDGSQVYGTHKRVSNVYTHYYPTNIQEFSNADQTKAYHPTQKPVPLFEYLIKTYTNEGELVLDNCMGSGTTGVACKNLNRKFIGIELDENYFNLAKERIESTEGLNE